jgi:hypothetical protein
MSSPGWQMSQKVGSPDGFKTNAEYDAAWAGLHKINEELYGEKNIYGGRGPKANRLPDAPQQPQPNTPSPTGKAPDMSVYTPGKAQPTQTQDQGTPYGQLPQTGSPATSYADAWNAAMPKGGNGVTFTPARSVIGAGAGNMAYAQPGQRPEGFVTQSYDLQGNPVAQGQQAQQRDAFIAQILQAPRDTPQYDFQGMLGKAGDMVKDGWQNPFNFGQQQGTAQPVQQPDVGQNDPEYQRWRQANPRVVTMVARSPEQEYALRREMYEEYLQSTGRSAPPQSFTAPADRDMPQPGRRWGDDGAPANSRLFEWHHADQRNVTPIINTPSARRDRALGVPEYQIAAREAGRARDAARNENLLSQGYVRGPMPGQLISPQIQSSQRLQELGRRVSQGIATPSEREQFKKLAGPSALNYAGSEVPAMGPGGGAMR